MSEQIPELIEPGMRLGRHLNHDPRSRLFKVTPETTGELRDVEHTIAIPPLDQGSLGSCVLNSAVHNLASPHIWNTLNAAERAALTEELAVDLYRETTRTDPYQGAWEPDDTGTDALSAAKVLRSRGLISGWLHAFSPVTALAQLQLTPVHTGISWKTGCDTPDRDGIIHWTGQIRGGHEVLAHKYDAARQLVGIRQSWGTRWGLNGECWMPAIEWQAALQADGDALVFVPRTQPAPTPVIDPELAALAAGLKPWADDPHGYRKATNAAALWRAYAKRHGL